MADRHPTRRGFLRSSAVALAAPALVSRAGAQGLDSVTFGTNWLPDAERGGFYQGIAAGIFRKHGLEVTVQAGGPQLNNPQLLAAGRLDAVMVTSAIEALNYARNAAPITAVAGIYQKSPQILVAHAASGIKSLEEMKGKPILIAALARNGYWLWLKAKYGFTDEQIRPYTFNLAPFISNPQAIQQGFVTYEPNQVRQAGVEPVVFLLADHGFDDFGGIIVVRNDQIERRRDVVRRFVLACSEAWRDFLFADSAPGLRLIKSLNDRLTDDIIANSMKVMRERELLHGGEAREGGIGAMSEARWRSIYTTMSASGIVEPGDYWQKAFDLSFVKEGLSKAPA